MIAITKGDKTIEFVEHENSIGRLHYKRIFSKNATFTSADSLLVVEILKTSIWKSGYSVRKGGEEIFTIKSLFGARVIIKSNTGQKETFHISRKVFFGRNTVLKDKDDRELATMHTTFRWRKLRIDYHFEISEALKNKTNYLILPVIMVFTERARRQAAAAV